MQPGAGGIALLLRVLREASTPAVQPVPSGVARVPARRNRGTEQRVMMSLRFCSLDDVLVSAVRQHSIPECEATSLTCRCAVLSN